MRNRDSRSGPSCERRPRVYTIFSVVALTAFASFAVLTPGVGQLLQQEQPVHSPSGLPPPNPLANPRPDANQVMQYEMQRTDMRQRIEKLNTLRQKEMTDETTQLLRLAREVQEKTTPGSPSFSAMDLHKIEAIEKLARSVREKMEFTVSQ